MCGLLGAWNTQNKIPTGTPKTNKKKKKEEPIGPVNEWIINQYENQASRGTEGYGIIRIKPDLKIEIDRATECTKFMLDLYMKESPMIIAHHRKPTSTDNKMDQTHPIYVDNKLLEYKYLVIHNGIVTNEDALKERHERLGFKYTTEHKKYAYSNIITTKFNDTESLAIELALFIEDKIKAIGTESRSAFIILQLDKKEDKATKVFFGRKGGDLNMSKTRGKLRLSSEGEGTEVKDLKLYSFDIKDITMNLRNKDLKFETYKKPEIVKPTKEEFTNPLVNHLKLPFHQAIGNKEINFDTGLTKNGIIHAKSCQCNYCIDPVMNEDPEEMKTIIYDANGKGHASNCKCSICADDEPSISKSNNVVQTDTIEYYDDKLVDQEVTRFEDEIKGKIDTKIIIEQLDETLDNLLDQISTITIEYKDNLYYNIEMEAEENYHTQIRIYMDIIKAVCEKAHEKIEKNKAEEEIQKDIAGYYPDPKREDILDDEDWGGHGYGRKKGPIGFNSLSNLR